MWIHMAWILRSQADACAPRTCTRCLTPLRVRQLLVDALLVAAASLGRLVFHLHMRASAQMLFGNFWSRLSNEHIPSELNAPPSVMLPNTQAARSTRRTGMLTFARGEGVQHSSGARQRTVRPEGRGCSRAAALGNAQYGEERGCSTAAALGGALPLERRGGGAQQQRSGALCLTRGEGVQQNSGTRRRSIMKRGVEVAQNSGAHPRSS